MSVNVYDMVTERIIEQLKQGIIPWQKPWHGIRSGAYNRITNKPYSLMNQMLLQHDGAYASYKQWADLGGHVRKGAKAEIVIYWNIQPIEEEKEDDTKVVKQIPILRYYNVFHISQVDGVQPKEIPQLNKEIEPLEQAEKVKEDYKTREHLRIEEVVTDKAFYSPSFDYVQVPCKEQYEHIEEFYSTLFHELIHSTGHKTRLNRLDTTAKAHFGSENYSREELCAECGSAMIMNLLGIETTGTFKNSTAYIQNWLQVLKNDNHFIISASSKAEKAVKYILGETE